MCNKMSEKEGKEEESAPLIEETSQLLNPFVHRLELNTAYDKFKVRVRVEAKGKRSSLRGNEMRNGG